MTAYILGWIKCIALTVGTIWFLRRQWKEAYAPKKPRRYDPAKYTVRPLSESIYGGPVARDY